MRVRPVIAVFLLLLVTTLLEPTLVASSRAVAATPPMAAAPAAGTAPTATAAAPTTTAAGIPLDAPWKAKLYGLARSKFIHPAWGWQHSERDYLMAVRLAKGDGLHVDTDVLFAAAFLHDMAAFMPCKGPKMEHGECAARQSGAMLRGTGFPMRKLAAVQAAERGHMFYSDAGSDPDAIVLHDADSLDFLGDIGAARLIALTGAKGPSFTPAVKTLQGFLEKIPPRLITRTARRIGAGRTRELDAFLHGLRDESLGGRAM